MMRIQSAGHSHRGQVRSINEDRWFADSSLGLFIVADGMGGGPHGEVAAEAVVRSLPLLLKQVLEAAATCEPEELKKQLCDALVQLSDQIYCESSEAIELEGMGSTVVAVLVAGSSCLVAHLGDSRAYRWRNDELELLTVDHSLVQLLMEAGELLPDEVDKHAARGQLTRFVGMPAPASPEVRWIDLMVNDRLMLCSDGISGMLSGRELEVILGKDSSPEIAVQDLVEAANSAGGRDNLTAVVIQCEESRTSRQTVK
ncbi:MAG: protein phosphatase 2C domain-containing protein [Planctomycetota bacterium]|nr:protein phosphatase 2C domain-containing protein [Planctomycetota bacterium]